MWSIVRFIKPADYYVATLLLMLLQHLYNTGQSVAQHSPVLLCSAVRLRPHLSLSQWCCGSVKPSARLPVYLILRSPGKTIHKLCVLITDWFYAFYYLCYHRCCQSTEAWITCLSFGHYLTLDCLNTLNCTYRTCIFYLTLLYTQTDWKNKNFYIEVHR